MENGRQIYRRKSKWNWIQKTRWKSFGDTLQARETKKKRLFLPVVHRRERPVSFLACCIPDLKLDDTTSKINGLSHERSWTYTRNRSTREEKNLSVQQNKKQDVEKKRLTTDHWCRVQHDATYCTSVLPSSETPGPSTYKPWLMYIMDLRYTWITHTHVGWIDHYCIYTYQIYTYSYLITLLWPYWW